MQHYVVLETETRYPRERGRVNRSRSIPNGNPWPDDGSPEEFLRDGWNLISAPEDGYKKVVWHLVKEHPCSASS